MQGLTELEYEELLYEIGEREAREAFKREALAAARQRQGGEKQLVVKVVKGVSG